MNNSNNSLSNTSSNSLNKNSNVKEAQTISSNGFKSNRKSTQTSDTEQNKLYEKIDTDGAHSGYVLGYN